MDDLSSAHEFSRQSELAEGVTVGDLEAFIRDEVKALHQSAGGNPDERSRRRVHITQLELTLELVQTIALQIVRRRES